MKIIDVSVLLVKERAVLVKVYTDEGIVGIGECSPMDRHLVTETVLRSLKPRLIGKDPFDLEKIVEDLTISTYKLRGRLHAIAISGIEIALWDIIGKAVDKPVYKLLGGEYRNPVRVYASSMRRDLTPLEAAKRAADLVEAGFGGVKLKIGVRWGFDSFPDSAIATVKEARAAIGDSVDLLVDANSAYSAARAIQVGRRLEQYGVFHYEEPVPENDIDSLAKVAHALDIPVAAGEQNHTRWEFKELITRDAADIIQPDVTKAGGLMECKKIASMGEAFGKICTPHNTSLLIGCVAALHFVASTPSCRYALEYNIEPNPLRDIIFTNPLTVVDGHLSVPQGPGLGVELNPQTVEQYGVEVR